MKPPVEAVRRKRLIDAAEHEFLRDGYHAATMDRIAARAGMSKKTIYQIFPAKEALFRAMVADRRAPLTETVPSDGRAPEALLIDLLSRAAAYLLARRQIALCRVVVAGSLRSPRLARTFLAGFHEPGVTALERGLSDLAGRGAISIDDPHEAAKMLFGLTIGSIHMEMLVGHEAHPAPAALERRIRTAVGIFLRGAAGR